MFVCVCYFLVINVHTFNSDVVMLRGLNILRHVIIRDVFLGADRGRRSRENFRWKKISSLTVLPSLYETMDANKLVEVLRATLDPNQREEAEKQLEIVSFSTCVIDESRISWLPRNVRNTCLECYQIYCPNRWSYLLI